MKRVLTKIVTNKTIYKTLILIFFIILCLLISWFLFRNSVVIGKKYSYNYSKVGTSEYKVYLKENSFYEEEYIDENMQYVSGLIDYIEVIFNYDFKSELNVDYFYDYEINAKIVISDKNNYNKIIYKKDDILLDKDNNVIRNINISNINESVKVNFEKYKAVYESFRKEYALSVDGYLIVSLNIDEKLTNINNFDDINDKDTISIKIPLSLSTIDITKTDLNENNNINITDKFEIVNKYIFVIFILFVIVSCSLILLLFVVVKFVIIGTRSLYEKNLKKILSEYDRAIVESGKNLYDLSDYKIIEVNEFEELLDARDNLNNPIIYINIKTGVESWFILLHNDLAYRYILKAGKNI